MLPPAALDAAVLLSRSVRCHPQDPEELCWLEARQSWLQTKSAKAKLRSEGSSLPSVSSARIVVGMTPKQLRGATRTDAPYF